MSYKYRYIGDLPTAFINLERPWEPSKGDLFESSIPIAHPLLEPVTQDASASQLPAPSKESEEVLDPDDENVPEKESPVTDDAEEN